jgi:hypothetical protein
MYSLKRMILLSFLLVVFSLRITAQNFIAPERVSINFLKSLSDTVVTHAIDYSNDTIEQYKIWSPFRFAQEVKFTKAIFLDTLYWNRVNFKKDIDLREAKFLNSVTISGSNFLDMADFAGANIDSGARFSDSHFNGFTNFSGISFKIYADFRNAEFRGFYTRFDSDTFDIVDFTNAFFYNDIDFRNSYFSYSANFDGAHLLGHVDFSFAKFNDNLQLASLTMNDSTDINFTNTCFPDIIDFSFNANINNEIDFTKANFSDSNRFDYKTKKVKPTFVFLYKTNVSKLHLDYVHYKLYLPDSTISNNNKIFITTEEKQEMYQALLTNFKNHGQEESYKLCDIDYQRFKWSHSWASFLLCMPYYWNHFGYDKQMVFKWTFWFILGFTLVTCIFIGYLNTQVYKVENIPPSFRNFGNRLWFSFIYTSTVFFRLTLKIEKINFERKWGTVYLILMYTIGLICLAYMANFVLQK